MHHDARAGPPHTAPLGLAAAHTSPVDPGDHFAEVFVVAVAVAIQPAAAAY